MPTTDLTPNPESLTPSTSPAPAVVRLKLVGANPAAKVSGTDELPGRSNYFIGNDPKKWRTNVPNYAKVKYQGVYPGVDLVYYGNQQQLEYDFIVAPGADPHVIAISIDGAEKMQIDAQGDLVLSSDGGDARLHKPVIYQPTADNGPRTKGAANSPFTIHNSELVDGRFVLLADNRVGFEVGAYDPSQPLIIDPVLSYSTYLGGSGDDGAYSIAVDVSGNAYVAGYTNSINFPTTSGAYQTGYGGGGDYGGDAFVTKLNASGTDLVYSTYLGGSGDDYGFGIAVDAAGNVYVTGNTGSSNFPTKGAFQPSFWGGRHLLSCRCLCHEVECRWLGPRLFNLPGWQL